MFYHWFFWQYAAIEDPYTEASANEVRQYWKRYLEFVKRTLQGQPGA